MREHLWVIIASVAPLLMATLLPWLMLWTQHHKARAKEACDEVLGLKKTLSDTQKFELVGSMVAGLVHDMNNIHMAIIGNLDLVLMFDHTLQEDTRLGIQRVRAVAGRGTEVMQTVLSFSRADQAAREVDIAQVVRETEGVLRLMIPREIQLIINTPVVATSMCISKTQLFQVIMNLVVNARDAIASLGRPGGVITVSLVASPSSLVLQVADTGCGIAQEVMPHIFDWRFTTKVDGKGTGLGLSIVKEAVESMAGTIEVLSEVGKGSTFVVTLPRR